MVNLWNSGKHWQGNIYILDLSTLGGRISKLTCRPRLWIPNSEYEGLSHHLPHKSFQLEMQGICLKSMYSLIELWSFCKMDTTTLKVLPLLARKEGLLYQILILELEHICFAVSAKRAELKRSKAHSLLLIQSPSRTSECSCVCVCCGEGVMKMKVMVMVKKRHLTSNFRIGQMVPHTTQPWAYFPLQDSKQTVMIFRVMPERDTKNDPVS